MNGLEGYGGLLGQYKNKLTGNFHSLRDSELGTGTIDFSSGP